MSDLKPVDISPFHDFPFARFVQEPKAFEKYLQDSGLTVDESGQVTLGDGTPLNLHDEAAMIEAIKTQAGEDQALDENETKTLLGQAKQDPRNAQEFLQKIVAGKMLPRWQPVIDNFNRAHAKRPLESLIGLLEFYNMGLIQMEVEAAEQSLFLYDHEDAEESYRERQVAIAVLKHALENFFTATWNSKTSKAEPINISLEEIFKSLEQTRDIRVSITAFQYDSEKEEYVLAPETHIMNGQEAATLFRDKRIPLAELYPIIFERGEKWTNHVLKVIQQERPSYWGFGGGLSDYHNLPFAQGLLQYLYRKHPDPQKRQEVHDKLLDLRGQASQELGQIQGEGGSLMNLLGAGLSKTICFVPNLMGAEWEGIPHRRWSDRDMIAFPTRITWDALTFASVFKLSKMGTFRSIPNAEQKLVALKAAENLTRSQRASLLFYRMRSATYGPWVDQRRAAGLAKLKRRLKALNKKAHNSRFAQHRLQYMQKFRPGQPRPYLLGVGSMLAVDSMQTSLPHEQETPLPLPRNVELDPILPDPNF